MASIAIKLYSAADVRRTRLAASADYNALAKQASAAFGVEGDIKWKDEDGDLVNVKCDSDWRECVNYNGGAGAIKLHFFPTAEAKPAKDKVLQADATVHSVDQSAAAEQQQQRKDTVAQPAAAEQEQRLSESPVEIEVVSDLAPTPPEQIMPEDSEFILAERVAEWLTSNGTNVAEDTEHSSTSDPTGEDTATEPATIPSYSAAPAFTGNTGNTEDANAPVPTTAMNTAAAATEDVKEVIHHGVKCDASSTNQELHEVITHPGAEPVPFKTSTFPLVKDMIRTHCAAREELHRQQEEKNAKEAQRPIFAFIPPGDVIPPHEAAFGSVGPGVAQLQHALIAVGALSPSAIRYRAGFFGPRTTEAIRSYKERHGITSADNEFGTYNEVVRTQLLDDIDALVNGPDQAETDQQQQDEVSDGTATTKGAASAAHAVDAQAIDAHAVGHVHAHARHRPHFLHVRLAHLNGTSEPEKKGQQQCQRKCGLDACRHKQAQAESKVVSGEEFQKARQDIASKHAHADDTGADTPDQESDYMVVDGNGSTTVPAEPAESTDGNQAKSTAPATAGASGADVSKWAVELKKLADMGFTDTIENERLLEQHNGALLIVVSCLL